MTNPDTKPVLSPGFRRLLFALIALNGLVGGKRIVESFFGLEIYKKDFIQEYLMGKAILSGVSPYLSVVELAARWLPEAGYDRLRHPTPHPPLVGLLGVPFALLEYRAATVVWLGIELLCVGVSIALLARWWGRPLGVRGTALILLGLLGWVPLVEGLWFGQLTTLLFLLLLLAWGALRREADGLGGALLGLIFAIKLAAWPMLLFLALRRRWRAAAAAGVVIALTHGLAAAVLGIEVVRDYYLEVGPQVAALYRGHDTNYSLTTLGTRLFEGFGNNFRVAPLYASPALARLATLLVSGAALSAGMWAALRARSFDTAFGLLVGLGVLLSPIAWTHYLLVILLPAAILLRRMLTEGASKRRWRALFAMMLAISIAGAGYSSLAQRFAVDGGPGELPVAPFVAGMATLFPLFGLLGVLALLWRSEASLPVPGRAEAERSVATWRRRNLTA